MKLRGAALMTDENIHPDVVAYLRSQGCEVFDVKERKLFGASDVDLIQQAYTEQRVILTHDSDFGTLAIAAQKPIYGIVYLRPGHIRPEYTIGTLIVLFDQELDLTPPFIVVAKRNDECVKIRVRVL